MRNVWENSTHNSPAVSIGYGSELPLRATPMKRVRNSSTSASAKPVSLRESEPHPHTHTHPRQGLFSRILPHSMRRRFKPVWLGILNSTMGKQSGFRFLLETILYEATRRAIVLALFKNKSLMAYS